MADQQFHVVALSTFSNAFFDPDSRINLSRTSPQGYIPVGSPISGSIIVGLLSGGLIDVYNTLLPDILKAREEAAKQGTAGFPRPDGSAGSTDQPAVDVKVEVPVEEPIAEAPAETPAEVLVEVVEANTTPAPSPAPAASKSKAKAK